MKTISTLLLVSLLSLACLGSISFSTPMTKISSEASTTITPWPMFRHDQKHTGYTTSTAPSKLELLWNRTTNGPGAVTSSPAVANGMVFVGADDNYLYAFDEDTGSFKWTRYTNVKVHSSPAVNNGVVFIGSYDGKIYALNESTGLTVWTQTLVSGEVYSSPTVINGKIFVTAYETTGYGYAYVFALNETTGSEIWKWRILLSNFYDMATHAYSSPAVANGMVFCGAHSLEGIDRSSIFALNETTGAKIWEKPITNTAEIYSSPSVEETQGIVWIGADDNNLYGLDKHNGDLIRKLTVGGPVRSSPAIWDELVVFGSNDGKIYCYTIFGTFKWSYTTGGSVRSSPAIAEGKVFVGSDDGYIYVLNLTTGALLDKFNCGDKIESSPAVADGIVFVGSDNGKVYAFKPGLRPPTKIQFSLTPNPVIVGQTVTLFGNLTTTDNLPIGGANIKIKSNGSQVATLITNSTGWFKAGGPPGSAGIFNVTVEYPGSPQYLPSSAWEILTVKKAKNWIYSLFIPNPVNSGEPCELRGILVDQFSNPIQLATVTLEYSTDLGLTWNSAGTLTTNSYGVLSKTFTAPSPGTYLVRLSYEATIDIEPLIVR